MTRDRRAQLYTRMLQWRALAAAMLSAALLIAAGARVAAAVEAPPFDYEAAFTRNFPAVAGEHLVLDWALYAALVDGDVVAYAARLDPAIAQKLERAQDKGYQRQQLEAGLKQDQRLRAAFAEQRRRVKAMVLYADGNSAAAESCPHALVYVGKEFRLVLGESVQSGNKLALATVLPSCARFLEPGFQLTGGRSPRFKCWPGQYDTTCGWRLPDMPDALKRVIENDYPKLIKLRWRWHGLGGVAHVRYDDPNANRVTAATSIELTIPIDLGLEFVDGKGQVLWTAAASHLQ